MSISDELAIMQHIEDTRQWLFNPHDRQGKSIECHLYPCPMCDTKPECIEYFIKGVANRKNYYFKCPNCGFKVKEPHTFNTQEKALKFWNIEHFKVWHARREYDK